MRTAINSVAAYLAEGTAKITNKDKAHFTTIDVLNHIILSKELRERIYKMLNALKKAPLNK